MKTAEINLISSFLALAILLLLTPIWFFLYIIVKATSRGPFIYKQRRLGKDKKPFTLYKIRTMVDEADNIKKNYVHLNEADGPVFKIRHDPRYTKVGKFLSHTGLDELPQLFNVVRGEMSFVGPRPLPVEEALKVPSKYRARFSVLPGITSSWILNGAHRLNFEDWMNLDLEYIKKKNLGVDIYIGLKTLLLLILLIFTTNNTKQK
ncbi:MAG: hypothetical protein A3A47_04515 [Candidatus Levybacteria bacterium RIFCSPLOWO2_01_FULL_37_20]|nr:MAG: hypothetical protein A3A47_04515 [Candidatus Levybacteria bacterium RIFCSPLOWO2_01_FULL_37_20]